MALDDAVVKIMSALGVSFVPAYEAMKEFETRLNALSAKVANTKMTVGSTPGTQSASQALSPITAQQALITKATSEGEAKRASAIAKGEAQITAITAKEALARQKIIESEAKAELLAAQKANEQIKQSYMQARSQAFSERPNLLTRHLSWFATGAILFEGFDVIKEGLVDIEKGMKGLSTVLPEVHENQRAYNEAQENAINLMQKYGSALDETMTAARSFGRMYKEEAIVMGLVSNSILMNVVDNVKLEEAVRGNEAALAVYGKELKSFNEIMAFSNHTMDAWTRLSHETMASATDLINITERASGAAKVAQTSFDELMGLGSSAIRATGLPGANIGNMLKTVMAQLAAPTEKTEEAIKEVGVAMRDTNGQLRSGYDTLLDLALATKDATISQEELAEAEKAAASGKFQYSKVAALMGQYDEIIKNTARSINNQGMTMQMAAQQMDTIERKAKMLKATLVDMFSGAGDSGLRTTLKGLIDTINQFLMGFNRVSSVVINSGIAIGVAVLAWKALQATFAALLPVMASVTGAGATMAGTMLAIETGTISAATGAEMLGSAMSGLTAKTAMATAGLSLLIGGLVYLVYRLGDAEKAQQELLQSTQEQIAIQQQRINQEAEVTAFLDKMSEQHDKLTKKLSGLQEGTKEYSTVLAQRQAVEEAVLLAVDDSIEEEIKREGAWNNEITKAKELTENLRQAAIAQMELEIAKTKNLLSESNARIEQYQKEANAAASAASWIRDHLTLKSWAFGDQGESAPWYKKSVYQIVGDAVSGRLKKQLASEQYDNAKLKTQIAQDELDLAKYKGEYTGSTGVPGGGPSSKSGGGSGSSTDPIKEYLQALADAADKFDLINAQLEASLDSVNQKLSVAGAEYDYLSAKMESGSYTAQDYARMQELVAIKSALITDEQNRLSNANDVYQREIAALAPLLSEAMAEYEKYKNAGDVEHMEDAADAASSLQGDIDSLTSSIADNTAKIYSNKTALDELSRSTYAKYYQNMKDWLSHMEAIGEMSVKQQLKYLDALDETKLSMKDLWDLQEREYQARKKLLDDEMKSLKKAYDTRMDYYEEEIKANERLIDSKKDAIDTYRAGIDAQIAAIKELMDLLDEEDESADRESQLQDHNEAIADLEEQLLYEQVRTGIDHQRNMEDIQKQMAEENRKWAEKQAQWGRQDQKDAYQDQIDALEEKADAYEDAMNEEIKALEDTNDAKKDEMERYYDQIQDMLDESAIEMLASLSLHGDEAVSKVEEIMRKIKTAIENGNLAAIPSLTSQLQAALGVAQDTYDSYTGGGSGGMPTQPGSSPVATFSSGEYYLENGRSYASSRTIASKLGQSISWDGSMVTIGGKKFYPAKIDSSGLSYLGINTVATALGYGVNWDQASGIVSILKQAHTGAYVTRTGAAELLKGERVLSPELTVSFDRLASILAESSLSARGVTNNNIFGGNVDMSVVERKLDRLIAVMSSKNILPNGPLVNIEHAGFEDRADMQALGVQVRSMITARG